MEELYEKFKKMLDKYNPRSMAAEILDVEGMENAIIDELRERGYKIEDNIE